jgi:uncharacterized protein (TIGR02284 family)
VTEKQNPRPVRYGREFALVPMLLNRSSRMETNDKETIAVLNDLIATCKDGVSGFRSAADAVKIPAIKALFISRIASIEQSASDLQAAVRRLGGDPTDSGHAAASLHRGWMNLKAAIAGKDDHEIIEEVIRGEESAIKHYSEAVQKNLPDPIRGLVQHQMQGALQNLASVRALLTGTTSPPRARTESGVDAQL